MNKKVFWLLLSVFLLLDFSGCSEDKSTLGPATSEMKVVAGIDNVLIEKSMEFNYFFGRIKGEPLPELYNFKINLNIYDSEDNSCFNLNGLSLQLTDDQQVPFGISTTDNLELNTDRGSTYGEISPPPAIGGLSLNGTTVVPYDITPVELNTEIDLAWTYGIVKPDFVYLSYWYEWYDENMTYRSESFSKAVSTQQSSVRLFESDETFRNGDIWINISSVNGPAPENAAQGNMTGYGSGFFYKRLLTDSGIVGINVGEGLYKKTATIDQIIEKDRGSFIDYVSEQH